MSSSKGSKGGMKAGGVIPKSESLYKGSVTPPTFIPPFEASHSWVLTSLKVSGCGSFRKFGVPYFGVLMIRILLVRVLY